MLVVDAGAMVQLLLRMPGADRAWQALESAGDDLHAPELFDVEVLSVLRKLVLRGAVTDERASEAVADLQKLGILRHSHAELLNRAWALRGAFTPYDALYVALTESLGDMAALLTSDRRLGRAVSRQTTARVVDLGPS
jgi:predicted nucleic acid-binding protein